MAEVGGLLGLFRSRPQELAKTGCAALSDDALIDLIFTEADSLPMEFAQEAISRGGRLVPALAEAALDRDNWDRSDSGWCSAFHACFLLGAQVKTRGDYQLSIKRMRFARLWRPQASSPSLELA